MNHQHQESSTASPSTKPDFVRKGFASIASKYDLLNDLMTLGMHRSWKKETINKLPTHPDARILDLCAGTGDLAFTGHSKRPGQTFVALDFTLPMMQQGKQRQPKSSQIVWLCGDALQLPFPDHTFDGVCVGFGLRNLADLQQGLHEIFRVIKPGGILVSLDTAHPEWKILQPLWSLYMNYWVPLLGKWLAQSKTMYGYLTSSSEEFLQPPQLCEAFQKTGFVQTGYSYRPRGIGGAAITWGQKQKIG